MPSIGERLLEERERMGLSQSELAEICGVTMRSQRNYEKGEREPDASYLAALTTTKADVLYILTGQRTGGVPPPQLAPDEAALLDNYRHSPKDQQDILKATSAAFAQRPRGRRSA